LQIVKVPKPMRMVWGSLIAYWLAGIINPAFIAIAVMIALFIPVLIVDPLFPSRPES
jgi:predicted signal transduction protein with EAL and GGDEF domain